MLSLRRIEEVGEPLRKYISSKDNFNEFLNVSYPSGNKTDANKILFDVLIDSEHIVSVKNNDTEDIGTLDFKISLKIMAQ